MYTVFTLTATDQCQKAIPVQSQEALQELRVRTPVQTQTQKVLSQGVCTLNNKLKLFK